MSRFRRTPAFFVLLMIVAATARVALADAVDDTLKERETKIQAVDKATVLRLEQIARGAKIKKDAALETKAWAEVLNIVPDHAEALKATAAKEGAAAPAHAPPAHAEAEPGEKAVVTAEEIKAIRDAQKRERDGEKPDPTPTDLKRAAERKLEQGADSLTEKQYAARLANFKALDEVGGVGSSSPNFFTNTFPPFCAKAETEASFAKRLMMGKPYEWWNWGNKVSRQAIANFVAANPAKFKTPADKVRFAKKLKELFAGENDRFRNGIDQYIADQKAD